jgi:hypothetical protein
MWVFTDFIGVARLATLVHGICSSTLTMQIWVLVSELMELLYAVLKINFSLDKLDLPPIGFQKFYIPASKTLAII